MTRFEFFVMAQAWAAAGEAEPHAPSINQLWFPLGNFLIFAFLIVRYAFPLVRSFLESRRGEVVVAVNEASARKRQAEALVQDYRGRLARLDQEVKSIQAALKTDGEREKARLLSEAQQLAAKTRQDAQFLADQEVKGARRKIREEMANEAEARARQLAQQHLSAADQGRLVEEFLRDIQRAS